MKLVIGYFYPELLNLYGDNGNVEILASRAAQRHLDVEIKKVGLSDRIDSFFMADINLVFMGGGPDAGQKAMYEDLVHSKGPLLRDYIENGGVGLFICGSYQLLGQYYKSADESVLEGLKVFDLYTRHFGKKYPRCIGNAVCRISQDLLSDPVFQQVNRVGNTLVGFENHGGRTYLQGNSSPLGQVIKGYGNNAVDHTEGIHYKNCLGTYLHGPLLSKNPHLADYLIAKSLNLGDLEPLDDKLILAAHTASKNLKR